jgi:hypothetical protein
MVEFALVIPVFMALIVGISELSFLLTIKTEISFASQNATQLAAELGNTADADCMILQGIDQDTGAPAAKANLKAVNIFWTDFTGTSKAADVWTKPGLYHCAVLNTDILWSKGAQGYPTSDRCNILSGVTCTTGHGGAANGGVDWIGVTINYQYKWITPLPGLTGLGGAAPMFSETHISRLEPVQ